MSIPIHTVTTDRFTMDYCRFGGGPQPLVILPGLSVQRVMTSADAIAEAYQLLTEAFTVYVLERRNDLPSPYPVAEMAEDTAAAIRALSLGPVCLFGASQGGMIAMKIAAEHSDLVRKLILGSTSARVPSGSLVDRWIRLAQKGDAAGLIMTFAEALYPSSVFEQSRDLFRGMAETVTEEDLQRFVLLAEGMQGFDATDDLKKISCPVLVIGSEEDRVLGGDASRQIMEQLKGKPGCELYMYDGYGHAVYDLASDYTQRMLQFLTKQTPIDPDTEPQIEMSEDEKIRFVAERILQEHKAAFEELAN